MKRFLFLLVGGFAVFMILAIADEWAYFSSAWFGGGKVDERGSQPLSAEGAKEALRAHLGDLERVYARQENAPLVNAGPEVVGEIDADLHFLRGRRWGQSLELEECLIDGVFFISPARAEIQTRERWKVILHRPAKEEEARRSEVRGRYRMQLNKGQWSVVNWDALPPGDFAAGLEKTEPGG